MATVLADANFTKEDIAMDRQPPDSKIYLNHTLEDYAPATFRCPRKPTLILGVYTVPLPSPYLGTQGILNKSRGYFQYLLILRLDLVLVANWPSKG